MGRCETCEHWIKFGGDSCGEIKNAGKCLAIPQAWDACEWDEDCESRIILPKYSNRKAFVKDGSDYYAELQTLPDFGCVMHEPAKKGGGHEG